MLYLRPALLVELPDDTTSLEIPRFENKYNKSAAQICLIWEIQKGIIPIPKTLNRKRMMENLDIFDVSLSREEMNIMDNIKICQNSGHHPDSIDF